MLRRLHNIDFTYTIPLDANRYEDGINLRYEFGSDYGITSAEIASELDIRPCSVLEMMVALAIKMESLMIEVSEGERVARWFWSMIDSLGLSANENREEIIDRVIFRFLDHEYDVDGKGGLFTVPNYRRDMRTPEIWYQMQWYLEN